jgi:hypothetical protein
MIYKKNVKNLDLRFSVIDLRKTPLNEYVFLEVSPGGQFLFAEIHGDQKITDELAKTLASQNTPFRKSGL